MPIILKTQRETQISNIVSESLDPDRENESNTIQLSKAKYLMNYENNYCK